jgi:IS30 family transposase
MAIEYFTKWVEAKLVTNVSSATIKKFFCQNIIYCYGVPRHITVDNAMYFDNMMYKDFCHHVGTKVAFASVYHPQSNGVVERANALVIEALKKIFEGEKKRKMGQSPTTGSMESQSPGQQVLHHSGCCSELK